MGRNDHAQRFKTVNRMVTMLRRSFLYCPGDQPEMMQKALSTEADSVVFDIEDSVAPGAKSTAREEITRALSKVGDEPPEISVRINPLDAGGINDLCAISDVTSNSLDRIVLPEVEKPAAVTDLSAELEKRELDAEIAATIETARGVFAAPDIASAPDTAALGFGGEDLTADINGIRTPEGDEIVYARQRIVLAAAVGGITATDTVYTDIEDLEGLANDTQSAVEMGYQGKAAIHPSQIEVINDIFTPDPPELEWAERVLKTDRETDAGVFTVDGQMIDSPLIEKARTIIGRAEAAGIR